MSNQVQVDQLDIDKRIEAIAANAASIDEAAAEAEFEQTHDAESWDKGSKFVVDIIDAKVCPAWQLADSEKRDLAESLSQLLDRWFPGSVKGIDNWHPLMKLGFTAGAISLMRFDWSENAFLPMHDNVKDDDDASEQEGWPADGGDGGDTLGENCLSFTSGQE